MFSQVTASPSHHKRVYGAIGQDATSSLHVYTILAATKNAILAKNLSGARSVSAASTVRMLYFGIRRPWRNASFSNRRRVRSRDDVPTRESTSRSKVRARARAKARAGRRRWRWPMVTTAWMSSTMIRKVDGIDEGRLRC